MLDMKHSEVRNNIRKNLEKFACEFEKQGIQLVIAILPSRLHIYEDYIEESSRVPDELLIRWRFPLNMALILT